MRSVILCVLMICAAALPLALGGCDAAVPEQGEQLVVEAFLEVNQPPDTIVLRRTRALFDSGAGEAVRDAAVALQVEGRDVPYRPLPGVPGRYVPAEAGAALAARSRFALRVDWRGERATAEGVVPPPLAIDSIAVEVPPEPVEAVLLDSLRLGEPGTGAEEGFIYPVEVTLWWRTDFAETGPDSLYWIRARLKPYTSFSSEVVDLFLRAEEVFRERMQPRDARGRRRWSGIYAVPVASAEAPLPSHRLTVALLRSGPNYARFAATRTDPDRREPVSNVQGGLGIAAGIALDSVRVWVR